MMKMKGSKSNTYRGPSVKLLESESPLPTTIDLTKNTETPALQQTEAESILDISSSEDNDQNFEETDGYLTLREERDTEVEEACDEEGKKEGKVIGFSIPPSMIIIALLLLTLYTIYSRTRILSFFPMLENDIDTSILREINERANELENLHLEYQQNNCERTEYPKLKLECNKFKSSIQLNSLILNVSETDREFKSKINYKETRISQSKHTMNIYLGFVQEILIEHFWGILLSVTIFMILILILRIYKRWLFL
ncbi:unnamed protein product [Moneuplotes crassus]|uniref:Brl1/Brr6 domain-containing protein n=1 Tax=Euplotes crassus TaxID=5936 RepID=A0AAD1UBJ9_EUPCR|nr:unnamed protein product [Moneuplotes crassus]